MRLNATARWGALAILAAALVGGPAAAKDKPCDRGCLEGLVGKYLTALAAHDPAKLPTARGLVFVENDQPLKLGEGTWASVDGLGHYRHIFSDPEAGEVAVITTVKEHGTGAILDLRLKVQNRRIAEAESLIIRDPRGAARYEALGAPAAEWLQPVAPADRVPRDALVAVADKYLQGMVRNDPKGDYSFFDPDCNRLEHAQQTTNLKTPEAYGHSSDTDFSSMGCEAQYKTGFLGFVTAIRDRRYVVVDEERQAVFAFADLDHNGTVRKIRLSTGKDFVIPAYFDVPRTLQAGEAYRMRAGKLWRIEMTLTELPYGMKPPFDAAPEPARAKPVPARAAACDRDCLSDLLMQVLQAMADHRPADAPLAKDVRYTENGQVLQPGDGLWGTASAIAVPGDGLAALGRNSSAYKLALFDPATGQAGALVAVNENGTPGIMALRIKAAGGEVGEIEAVIVREEGSGPRGGTMTLFKGPVLADFSAKAFSTPDPVLTAPPAIASPRKLIAQAVDRYFDTVAYSQRPDAVVTPEGPTRLDGQPQKALVPPAGVRDRRVLLIDEDRGLALAAAVLDRDAEASSPAPPSSNLLAAVFKVDGNRISRVEAISRPVPYGMTTGWEERR